MLYEVITDNLEVEGYAVTAAKTLADLGVDAGAVGWAGAGQEITDISPVPARAAGEKFKDDGTAHEKIVAFLENLKVI